MPSKSWKVVTRIAALLFPILTISSTLAQGTGPGAPGTPTPTPSAAKVTTKRHFRQPLSVLR